MNRILITGGSGFIGTNLIEKLLCLGTYEILNIDLAAPKIDNHSSFWKKVDLRCKDEVSEAILSFMPDYVIALGARTDLNGISIDAYDANIGGVKNILAALDKVPNLKRLIYASSMYVCEPGYLPKDFDDYAPHTLYGESKVQTEKIIKSANLRYTWSILRPTSIWGPWFGEPYNKFFHIVLRHMYFHMGKRACKKTYGYVENAITQILAILNAEKVLVNGKVYYLGDYDPYPISEWANEIANIENIYIPQIPFFCFKMMGWLGDILKKVGITFPMTSFRLHNMTTDNVHNLDPIKKLAPVLPISRIEGTKRTLEWIHKNE